MPDIRGLAVIVAWTVGCVGAGASVTACGQRRSTTPTADSTTIPALPFPLPSTALSLTRAANLPGSVAETNVFTEWSTRLNTTLGYLNSVIAKLNTAGLQKAGRVAYTAADGSTVTATLADLSDTTYAQSATICVGPTPALWLKWSHDNAQIVALRDFSVDPWGVASTALKTQLLYQNGPTPTLTENSYGTPWSVPSDIASDTVAGGTYLGEAIVATSVAGGNFTLRGVNAWETTPRSNATAGAAFTGDTYLTGQLGADGTGRFTGWRAFDRSCSATFDDGNAAAPGWCFSATIASGGRTTFSTDTATEWTSATLAPIGIESSSSITYVDFPSTVTCPES